MDQTRDVLWRHCYFRTDILPPGINMGMWAVFGIWKMLEDQKHFVTNFGAHLTYQIFHVPLSFSLPENHLAIEPIGPRNVRDKGKNQGKIVSLLTWYQLPNIYLGGNGTNVLEFLMRILITFSQNLKQPWVECPMNSRYQPEDLKPFKGMSRKKFIHTRDF